MVPYFSILFILVIIGCRVLGATNDDKLNPSVNSLLRNDLESRNDKHHCPPPPIIPNAFNGLDDRSFYPVGTKAAYGCMRGHRHVSGMTTLTCLNPKLGDGKPQWEKPSLVCEPIQCEDPGDIPNARRRFSQFLYNHNVSYECNPGYMMKGIPFLLCTKDGRWNRVPPRCESEKKCSLKSIQSHGGIQVTPRKRLYEPRDIAIVRCHQSDHSISKLTVKCSLDGQWTPSFDCPVPISHECSSPGSIDDGYHNGSSSRKYPIGTKILYACKPGYILVGPSIIVCLPNDLWTADPPRCASFKVKSLPIISSPSSNVNFLVVTMSFLLVAIVTVSSIIFNRWRQRRAEKRFWRKYFDNHSYRQCKVYVPADDNQKIQMYECRTKPIPVTEL
ncbi:beta-2-glycoprotein 1-like [Brevipalpus obovatus]|uniref:beta-2-glycoprotein 1-like n=1 Tax=Brevipalpus obovatus TaxID=246614 RepID=UPI003D9E1715